MQLDDPVSVGVLACRVGDVRIRSGALQAGPPGVATRFSQGALCENDTLETDCAHCAVYVTNGYSGTRVLETPLGKGQVDTGFDSPLH